MCGAIGRILGEEDIHISGRLGPATVAAHDLNPQLRLNCKSCVADLLEQLAALLTRYA